MHFYLQLSILYHKNFDKKKIICLKNCIYVTVAIVMTFFCKDFTAFLV